MSIFDKLFRNPEHDGPKYKVGDIVAPRESLMPTIAPGGNGIEYLLPISVREFICCKSENPLFEIVGFSDDYLYSIREAACHPIITVPYALFDSATMIIKDVTTFQRGEFRTERPESNYKVGDIVKPVLAEYVTGTPDDGYWFHKMNINIYVGCKEPLLKIVDVFNDEYRVHCLGPNKVSDSIVPMYDFDYCTEPTQPISKTVIKDSLRRDFIKTMEYRDIESSHGIRKYKKVVRVCAEELAEILSLPFVDSITPLRVYFREKDIMWSPLWNSNGGAADCVDNYEASDFVVNTSLYSVPIRFGYFVQDACDGWRWMSDKDYEKHKDDIVTI